MGREEEGKQGSSREVAAGAAQVEDEQIKMFAVGKERKRLTGEIVN